MNIQIIRDTNGEELAVVISMADLNALLDAAEVEDKMDIQEADAIMQRVRGGTEEVFPATVMEAILEGAHPVQVFRKYRRMTQQEVATIAGINHVYLSQIERGIRAGSVETLTALAKALQVDLSLLAGWKR